MTILTWFVPRLNSVTLEPSFVSYTRISVPRSLAVANRVPSKLSAMQVIFASCAGISRAGL